MKMFKHLCLQESVEARHFDAVIRYSPFVAKWLLDRMESDQKGLLLQSRMSGATEGMIFELLLDWIQEINVKEFARYLGRNLSYDRFKRVVDKYFVGKERDLLIITESTKCSLYLYQQLLSDKGVIIPDELCVDTFHHVKKNKPRAILRR